MRFDTRSKIVLSAVMFCLAVGISAEGRTAPRAEFLGDDRKTQGEWASKYGKEGYIIVHDGKSVPAFVNISVLENRDAVIQVDTGERRALHRAKEQKTRIAAHWYCWSRDEFSIDLRFTDSVVHQFSVYAVDWNRSGWIEKIEFLDPLSRKVLNSQTLSDFGDGVYLTWNVAGHVTIRISGVKDEMASLSGIFFDPGAATKSCPAEKTPPK